MYLEWIPTRRNSTIFSWNSLYPLWTVQITLFHIPNRKKKEKGNKAAPVPEVKVEEEVPAICEEEQLLQQRYIFLFSQFSYHTVDLLNSWLVIFPDFRPVFEGSGKCAPGVFNAKEQHTKYCPFFIYFRFKVFEYYYPQILEITERWERATLCLRPVTPPEGQGENQEEQVNHPQSGKKGKKGQYDSFPNF